MWIPTPFLLIDIEAKFTENIHMCFNGSVENRNMDYISGPILDGKCYEPGVRTDTFVYFQFIFIKSRALDFLNN